MAKVNFKRIPDSGLIDNVPIEDGSIIITGDGKTYVDFENGRIPVCGTPDNTMSDKSTNTVQNNTIKEYVDSNNKKLSDELHYNLIPNADPIKTGRKIDGKEEWVKLVTYNSTLSAGMNKTSVNGLPTNANMHEYSVVIKPENGNDVVVKDGFFHSSTDFFAAHGYKNGNIQLMIGSAAQWVNSNLKCYMTLYYTLDEES